MRVYDRVVNIDEWENGELISWVKCLSLGKVVLGKALWQNVQKRGIKSPQGNPRRLLGEQKKGLAPEREIKLWNHMHCMHW